MCTQAEFGNGVVNEELDGLCFEEGEDGDEHRSGLLTLGMACSGTSR
jgi:hypothetical protein